MVTTPPPPRLEQRPEGLFLGRATVKPRHPMRGNSDCLGGLAGSRGEEMRAYLETCLRLPPLPPADEVRPGGRAIDVTLVSW
jgi:hypothetical protein